MAISRFMSMMLAALLIAGGSAITQGAVPVAPSSQSAPFALAATPTPVPAKRILTEIVAAPSVVDRGGAAVVVGSGFAADELIVVAFDNNRAYSVEARATPTGALPPTRLVIPAVSGPGVHAIVATGTTSGRSAVARVTVVAPAPPAPAPRPTPTHTAVPVKAAIAVAPAVALRDSVVTVSGAGFAAGEPVALYFDGNHKYGLAARATAAGLLPATRFTIPAVSTPGRHSIVAVGLSSGRAAAAAVTVIIPAPAPRPTATRTPVPVKAAITVAPPVVNRGGLVTVSGAGFAAGEIVTLYFSALPKGVTTARATGAGLLPATGVTVPYALGVGAQTIVAAGATSKRVASAALTVQALTPAIAISPSTASPGTIVTVSGHGFGSSERVTLALNGAALATTPPVITTQGGAFTATFKVPETIVDGPNTVGAIGALSRVAAVAALSGVLPVSARFYFAGALNTATEHSTVDLLNPNGQSTTATLTFYFDSGATAVRTVPVAPTSEQVVSVAGLNLPAGTFGLYVTANRHITAQLSLTRDGRDGDVLLGNTGLGTRWYLAEGYTGLTFHETVSVLNPDPALPAHVQMQLLPFGGRPGKVVDVTVAPHSNLVTDINALLPGQSLSVIATSDRPVVVERTLTFSNAGYGMTTRAGTNTAADNWLFAEGTTVNRFQTYLTILNPNALPARVTASFFGQTGGALGSKTIVVQGESRANLKLNDFLSASGIASVLTSDLPIVVERPEYFGSPNSAGIAGSDVFGLNGAGVRWSFPGGDTSGESEFLLVYNPSALPATIDVHLYGSNGQSLVKRIVVPPTVRYNVNVNTLAPGFAPIHGAILQSASGQGFIAEQTVFAPNYSALSSTQGLAQ